MAYRMEKSIFGPHTVYTCEYICKYCGMHQSRKSTMGRPMPGRCSRAPRFGGQTGSHNWILNRKY